MTVVAWSLTACALLTLAFTADEMVARGFGTRWLHTCYGALALAAACTLMAVLGAVS